MYHGRGHYFRNANNISGANSHAKTKAYTILDRRGQMREPRHIIPNILIPIENQGTKLVDNRDSHFRSKIESLDNIEALVMLTITKWNILTITKRDIQW